MLAVFLINRAVTGNTINVTQGQTTEMDGVASIDDIGDSAPGAGNFSATATLDGESLSASVSADPNNPEWYFVNLSGGAPAVGLGAKRDTYIY